MFLRICSEDDLLTSHVEVGMTQQAIDSNNRILIREYLLQGRYFILETFSHLNMPARETLLVPFLQHRKLRLREFK